MADLTGSPGAVWEFVEHEHRELVAGIDRIHDAACSIGGWVTPDQSSRVLQILAWVDREFGTHASWEEAWLYPEVDARTGTPWATRAARFEHAQIRAMASRLRLGQHHLGEQGGLERAPELRFHLIGLEVLLRAHLEREERYLLPLLAYDRVPVGHRGTPPPHGIS